MRYKSIGLILFIVLTVSAAAYFFVKKTQIKNPMEEKIGALSELEEGGVPGFNVASVFDNKKTAKLNDLKGKILIINLWASWCGPCVAEMSSLIKLVKASNDVVLVAISEDSELQEILSFAKSFPDLNSQNIFVHHDQDNSIADFFKSQQLPESFIFNKNGKLVKKIVGSINWYTEDSKKFIQNLQ